MLRPVKPTIKMELLLRATVLASCLVFSFVASAQVGQVTGVVMDAETLEPLPFANVFINNTTMGAPSDEKGNFYLKNVPAGVHEVVFSFVGYQPYQTHVTVHDGEIVKLNVKMVPEEKQLASIEVQSKRDKKWEKQLDEFTTYFIGTGRVARKCRITNPWVLEFTEKQEHFEKSMHATASGPLEIEDLALGYKITCILQGFVASSKAYSILGKYRYEEMTTNDEKIAKQWTENRYEAYEGSLRHMFASLVTGNLKEQGFLMYSDNPSVPNSSARSNMFSNNLGKNVIPLTLVNVLKRGETPEEYVFNFKGRLEVHYINGTAMRPYYKDIPYPVSWIEVKEPLHLSRNGVVWNSAGLVTSGAMSEARVAEMLPLDYQPFQKVTPKGKE